MEGTMNRLLPLIGKLNNQDDFLMAGLILDDIIPKDFERRAVSNVVLNRAFLCYR